ncbi:MAG: DUF1788 domain-containing protein [Lachnoclostridium sp.]|jgi:hypothetical protein|nr:DUF1788 domain-containing protein [Lachnoclostridium sp.]
MKEFAIGDRLNRIKDIIVNDPFFGGKSLSSGTGGYIFDYDPKDELIVRDFIENFSGRKDLGFDVQVFDLFEIMIEYLKMHDYLESAFEIEEDCRNEKEGITYMVRSMADVLQPDSQNDIFIDNIQKNAMPGNVLFIIGVGKCHPFIRSHKILNNFDSKLNGVKTILFYPGTYSSDELRLFGTIHSENYYRSMKIVERRE